MNGRVLLIDDDLDLRGLLADALRSQSYAVEAVGNAARGLELLQDGGFNAVITDIGLGGMSGLELCARITATRPDLPVILITGLGNLERAIAAIRAGAYDFITKPISIEVLGLAVQRAVTTNRLRNEVQKLRKVAQASQRSDQMIGESPVMQRLYDVLDRVAASESSVLICGETGTGKDLVARALHARSPRKDAPYVAVNCAAMPLALIESELFGHVRGAFTDAKQARPGLFLQAAGGTLFLDEIGEMPLAMQAKLLRALQERKIRPVGGDSEIPFDARLISATNLDLDEAVERGEFRRDLYYRINVMMIRIPPLRARGNDILLLAQHFLQKQAARSGKPVTGLSIAAVRKLLEYDWPGNVRELENCMERAVTLARSSEVGVEDLTDQVSQHQSTHMVIDTTNPEELLPMAEMELRYLRRALAAVGGNKTQAARVLGLDRRSFYRRLARLEKKQKAV
ncbi:MAG: sigma-54 dependent transcriptional regulator [Polyangia bacterium]